MVSELSARTGEAVSGKVEAGKAFVTDKAEQAGTYISSKAEQGSEFLADKGQEIYSGMEEAYKIFGERAMSAYESFQNRKNEIIQQVQAKLKERRDNQARARMNEITKQQEALSAEYNRLAAQVSGAEQFKSRLPSMEEEPLAA